MKKIIVIVRTLNEERNIERFCKAYDWADEILIADENSTDRTRELASQFPNTKVAILYKPEVKLTNGYRTSHGTQINFLIEWAENEDADWILFDDCDCWPNYRLKNNLRWIIENCYKDYIMAVRLYLWGKDMCFPYLSKDAKTGQWTPSLYGWRADLEFRCAPNLSVHQEFELDYLYEPVRVEKIYPPLCLLHNPWQDDEMVERKLNFYRTSGLIPNMEHPLDFAGPVELLPDWAKEEENED